jgi:hypothetical protein
MVDMRDRLEESVKKAPEETFKRIFGRDINVRAPIEVLNEGDSSCRHERIYHINNSFDGQAFWCDNPSCKRHERMDYSPGHDIPFPPGALISTPNPKYGAENFYAFRANDKGEASLLERKDWVKRNR